MAVIPAGTGMTDIHSPVLLPFLMYAHRSIRITMTSMNHIPPRIHFPTLSLITNTQQHNDAHLHKVIECTRTEQTRVKLFQVHVTHIVVEQ